MSGMMRLYTTALVVPLGFASSSQWNMWNNSVDPIMNPFPSQSPHFLDDDDSSYMQPRIMTLRDALGSHTLYLEAKIEEAPISIEELRNSLADRMQKYWSIVGDCSDVDLSTVAAPDEAFILGIRQLDQRFDYLKTLPREAVCWYIDNDRKKTSHKIMVKEVTAARMSRLVAVSRGAISEIDRLTTSEEIRAFYLDTFGIFASARGKWLAAVMQLVIARIRFDIIKAEFETFRDSTYAIDSEKSCQALPGFDEDIWTVSSAFVSSHGTVDIHYLRSVLEEGSKCLMRYRRLRVTKQVTERLNKCIGALGNTEMTLTFQVLGDSPTAKYNSAS